MFDKFLIWFLTFGGLLACYSAAFAQGVTILKYGDGEADGKLSAGGAGPMISFTLPAEQGVVTGMRIHGSRYGHPQPPQESFLIYFLSKDEQRVLHTELAPYSLFERGPEKWVDLKFEDPFKMPKEFWVVLDFRAHQTKGVYVSYDKSTGGKYSRVGLPGVRSTRPRSNGDWLIELTVDEAASAPAKASKAKK